MKRKGLDRKAAEIERIQEEEGLGLSLRVEDEEDAEDDHQQGPEAREGHLPASGELRQSFGKTNAESGDGETQVLGLDVSHYGHVIWTVHAGVVLVKQEQHRTKASEHGEQPSGPGRLQYAAGALDLDDAERQEDDGKRLVLHILDIVGEAVPPALRAEGPQLRVAENEQEQPGEQKTGRPGKAKERPALGKRALRKDENAGEDHEESRQMMVEFTFFLVGQELALACGVRLRMIHLRMFHLRMIVHGHRHAFVAGVVRLSGLVLRKELRKAEHEQRDEQGASDCKLQACK
jgi:hypothetical protein